MNRIEARFSYLKKNRRKAFVAFLTAGYPDLLSTAAFIRAFDRIGVDILELGIPFSDPIADGPVIQAASHEALRKGVTLEAVLRVVRRARDQGVSLPICFMSYYNPVFCYGVERFIRKAAASGVDGMIIPDLPLEEARAFSRLARRHGLDTILFISQTTAASRQKRIVAQSRGFIYYISLTGTTGARAALPPGIAGHVRRIKRLTAKPVCVGFGISTPAQVKRLQSAADGVIVGSAIVRKIKEYAGRPDMVERVTAFVASLKG